METAYKVDGLHLTRKLQKSTFQNENNSRKTFVLVDYKSYGIHETYKCQSNAYSVYRSTFDIRAYLWTIFSFASAWVKR